jgi:hypothetical protein
VPVSSRARAITPSPRRLGELSLGSSGCVRVSRIPISQRVLTGEEIEEMGGDVSEGSGCASAAQVRGPPYGDPACQAATTLLWFPGSQFSGLVMAVES